jgi:hypothetical protein
MTSIAFFRDSTHCALCAEETIAPVRSEYLSAIEIHYFWSCYNCGNEFETLDHLNAAADVPTELIRKRLPALIAA